MSKIVVRIKGGLGNQLFCYAAARRLALVNNAELVIDHVTGFLRDHQYRRSYALDNFNIPMRKATPLERMEPLELYRRGMAKAIAKLVSFERRQYVEQEGSDFDKRLLNMKVKNYIYLDGYWQSEQYFKDIEEVLREDLRLKAPEDQKNIELGKAIQSTHSIAIHVRLFNNASLYHNLSLDYYKNAIQYFESKGGQPTYFVFSNDPKTVQQHFHFPTSRVVFVTHNKGDAGAVSDLWLMSLCQHFITANSTFSWWGAWLGEARDKVVVTPDIGYWVLDIVIGGKAAFDFSRRLPDAWVKIGAH